jgi:SecD/SecF fusion protein
MQDKGLYWKLGLIVLVIFWAVYEITPWKKQLKGGIDLVGGHSLLYAIDTTGLAKQDIAGLSTRVMERLKVRVDPEGVKNLVWRPVGDTRLEIQMPLPAKEVIEKREDFKKAKDALTAINIQEEDIQWALRSANREQTLDTLVRGIPERKEWLKQVADAFDAWQGAIAAGKDKSVVDTLEQTYDKRLDDLLVTNINIAFLGETLEMEPTLKERQENLSKILEKYKPYPDVRALIENAIGAYEAWSRTKGSLDDPADLERLLRGQGVLEFRILPSGGPGDEYDDYISRLDEGKGTRIRKGDEFAWYEIAKPKSFEGGNYVVRQWNNKSWVLAYYNDPLRVLDASKKGWKLTRAAPSRDTYGLPAVAFRFNEIGANMFFDLTRHNLKQPLCILMDGKAYSAPIIQSKISERGEITGHFTLEETEYLASTLNAGSLDARLKDTPISKHSIGPSLGEDNLRAGFRAAIYGLIAIVAFMGIYYMWAGMIANIALIMNLLILLGVMAAMQATFTVAGIAGVILTMGMAVDANVLIYERMREESEKIQSLRLIVKNGYDRALSTILDSNITTLISCVVLYYISTEEIKGFALTLGLGLVISLFTGLFVTRVIFALLIKAGVIRSLPMLHFFRRPKINWVGKQKYFWAASATAITVTVILVPLRGANLYDIEFRGGTSMQIELKQAGLLDIEDVRDKVKQAGESLRMSSQAVEQGRLIADAQEKERYTFKFEGASVGRVEAAMLSFMEDQLERDSVQAVDANTINFAVKSAAELTPEKVEQLIKSAARQTSTAGKELAEAQVQSVGEEGTQFEIITAAVSQRLIMDGIIATIGKDLSIQPQINYDPQIKPVPITHKRLGEDIDDPTVLTRVGGYENGAAFVVNNLNPAVTVGELKARIESMRFQPDFKTLQWRESGIVGLTPVSGQATDLPQDQIRYTRVAVMIADPNYPYDEDKTLWREALVNPELNLLKAGLDKPGELQKITQFAPQVANQAKMAAVLALIVSFGAIILYLWIRFGTPRHGMAAVIAILHDVLVCLAFVCISAYLAQTFIGKALMIEDFKINLTLVAAFLTVVGYSVNDTIVVYDRIRENRGKLTGITPKIINDSVNQTLSRTVLTGMSTISVMIIMYIFGGEGVRSFGYVMTLGTIIGTYSSIAIASPMLLGWLGTLSGRAPNREPWRGERVEMENTKVGT